MIKRILFALVGLCIATAAHAQAVIYYKQAPGAGFNPVPVSVATPLPVTGTFSATISGGFTDAAIGTPIAVTTGGVTGTLPAGAAVVATNVGTTNGAYCHLGGTATTSDQYLSPNGGWFAYQVGVATQLTCITSASTTTVNMVGGSGLPTGTGGGGGGGGGSGGAVTIASGGVASGAYASGSIASGAVASGAYASGAFASGAAASGSWADGAIVTLGTKADTACTSAPCTTNGWLAGLPADLAAPTNLAYAATYGACVTVSSGVGAWCGDGKSTPYVDIGAVGTAAVLVGAGATGTGSQRVTAAQDTTTIAGSAPGTAGTPSANVLTVQGASGGTPVPTQQFSQYPVGSTAVTASATGTTGATTATLPQVASNYNFVCGYSIRANAAAATTVSDTLTGIISGTMTHELWVAPSASGIGVDEQIFNPCIPSSAVNTAISAVSGAPGTSGLVSSTIWGYYKTTSP